MKMAIRPVVSATFAVLAIAAGFVSGFNTSFDEGRSVPLAPVSGGPELVFVYIGSSTCGPSNAPSLGPALERLRQMARNEAERRGVGFATIGIARDRSAAAGIDHLGQFGAWDEVLSGRGWLNTGIIKYVYEDLPGRAATPQVVIVERSVRRTPTVAIESESVLLRSVGLDQITRSVALGRFLLAGG